MRKQLYVKAFVTILVLSASLTAWGKNGNSSDSFRLTSKSKPSEAIESNKSHHIYLLSEPLRVDGELNALEVGAHYGIQTAWQSGNIWAVLSLGHSHSSHGGWFPNVVPDFLMDYLVYPIVNFLGRHPTIALDSFVVEHILHGMFNLKIYSQAHLALKFAMERNSRIEALRKVPGIHYVFSMSASESETKWLVARSMRTEGLVVVVSDVPLSKETPGWDPKWGDLIEIPDIDNSRVRLKLLIDGTPLLSDDFKPLFLEISLRELLDEDIYFEPVVEKWKEAIRSHIQAQPRFKRIFSHFFHLLDHISLKGVFVNADGTEVPLNGEIESGKALVKKSLAMAFGPKKLVKDALYYYRNIEVGYPLVKRVENNELTYEELLANPELLLIYKMQKAAELEEVGQRTRFKLKTHEKDFKKPTIRQRICSKFMSDPAKAL